MKALLLALTLTPSLALSGTWTTPLNVQDVTIVLSDPQYNGPVTLRADFTSVIQEASCPQNQDFAVYSTSSLSEYTKLYSSYLLSAQAQNKQVKIYLNGSCELGMPRLQGVTILD